MLKIDETVVPLLKDFETYTSFLEENHVQLTSKENWIPPKILYELNGKMSIYVTPRSTPRTPQKSYVLLNLMFYLATEGKLFDKVKKKGALYLEPTDRLNAYRALTPTEKYFFLLETFWRDEGRAVLFQVLYTDRGDKVIPTWREDTASNDKREGYVPLEHPLEEAYLRRDESNPWISSTYEREGKEEITYTEEPFFLPFVNLFEEGELTKTLPRIPERIEFVDGVYIFKVFLLPKKEVWRRIKVSSDHTLSDLAEAIIDAYRFDHEHLYSFFMDGEKWSPYKFTSPDEKEGPHADRIKIGELNLRKRQKILFLYDYSREWTFEVELESIEEDKPKPDRPKIIEKHGRSPEQYPRWW
jgi:hypothetical protein